tara:strand:- start:40 stop:465 length:426 start_codon:yes stop_codon:yes gene_type:complete
MPKTGNYYHEVIDTTDASVTNAFNASNRTDMNLYNVTNGTVVRKVGSSFSGKLQGCVIGIKSVASSATKVTVKIAVVSDGTSVVVPDTEATIAFEVGSTTVGAIAISYDFVFCNADDQIHLFYKTDTGTCTVDSVRFFWSE